MQIEIRDNKVYNADTGEVAVLYSPGYGAGWYSWNTEYPDCIFDPDCVQAVLDDNSSRLAVIASHKWPDGYWSPEDVDVCWLAPGTQFVIHEYDGSESIRYLDDIKYHTA